MKKLFLTIAACAATLSASASGPWDLGGVVYEADTLFHETTGPGITTTGVRLVHPNNKTNIFYSTIDLTNPNIELRGVQAQDHPDKIENVLKMGDRKNDQGKGQYIAGVNGDFFNMGGNPTRTNGHSIVDGKVYNIANSGTSWRDTWGSYATVTGAKDIIISTGVITKQVVRFPDKQAHEFHINGGRWENYLVIYNGADSASTGTNQWGIECTMKLVSGSIAERDAVFEITSELATPGNMTIPEGGYVLSGVGTGKTAMNQLKVGDRVSLGHKVTYKDKEINPTQSVGGCSMIVMDGEIAPDEYFSKDIVDHFISNQARTVIGYNEDRTKLIILVADKYAKYKEEKNDKDEVIGTTVKDAEKLSYGTSTGMILKRMGYIMTHLGCYTAMNFDGGGSAQLYNKDLGIRNVPYGDTYLRPVANGFFAVSTTPVDNTVAAIEVRQKNVRLAEGETFTPIIYGYNQHGVLVNKNVTDFTVNMTTELGSVSGSTVTAGAKKGETIAVVKSGDLKCGIRVITNGGGAYVTSGDDDAPIMVGQTYESDKPMGPDKQQQLVKLTEQWSFVNTELNDGWDGTAPDWTSEDAIKAKSCPRFATGRNGKFYTVDMKTMSIAEIDNTGKMTPLYKLPSLEGRVINDVPDYYGCAISSDDAGNFLIGHLFTKADTYRVWTIYNPATGKAKHFEIEIPADEKSSGRIDNIGRVIGDLTNEAYAYVAPKATGNPETNKALIIKFSGDGDVDNVTATPTLSKGLWMAGAGNTFSTIQPKYATVEDMKGIDLGDTFYWYSKAKGTAQYTTDLFTRENGVDSPNYSLDWNNHSALNGFDTFTLGGKRYFAVAYSNADDKSNNQHIIVMDEESNRVAEWNNEAYDSGAGYNTITAVPVNENKVLLYVYNCTGDFLVDGNKTGAIAGALLTLTFGNGLPNNTDKEPNDITPAGLNFDNYYDGEPFKIFSTETNGAWAGPADFYKIMHPTAFEDYGQLTSVMYCGMGQDLNTQSVVDANIQPMVTVRKVNEHIGNALIINEQYSPLASVKGWTGKGFGGHKPQFSFYIDNKDIKEDVAKKHYVRVRLVYNALFRGCHHAQDLAANREVKIVRSIYSTHERNWVIPENDHQVGEEYAETGLDFAKWVDETGLEEDIPAVPVVYEPLAGEKDPLDPTHDVVSESHKVPYLMNTERFRVYEFDTYVDNPSLNTISVQFNILDRNISYIIKEIKFTDLGTDGSAATLLGKRKIGWKYYNGKTSTSGIEDIEIDENGEIEDENAPAVYYNLQGVQIKNPTNGIYIVRRGNKVTKEVIR